MTTAPDIAAAALAAGHAPDSLAVHAAQLDLTRLENPRTIADAASAVDEDGLPTGIVEVCLDGLMKGRANEEAGEGYPIARPMVEEDPEPAQMDYEVIGAPPTDMPTLVARFDLPEALGFHYDPEELDEMFGTES